MKHLRRVSKKYTPLMLVYFLLGVAQTFLHSFNASFFQKVIDRFTSNTLAAPDIVIYGTAMLTLYLLSYLDEYPGRRLEHGIELSLRTQALRKIAVIDYLAYIKLGTGALIQRIENGALAGSRMLFGFYLRLASDLLPAMLFSIVFIFAISPTVTAAVLLGYVAVFIIANLLLKALYGVKAGILVNEERVNHILVRGFMEMVVFRLHRRFAHEIRKAESASGEIVASKVKMTMIHEAFFAIFAILIGFVKIGIVAYGWITRELTIGEIVALIALVDNAYVPIAQFNVLYVQYKLDRVAFSRYTEFLDAGEDLRLTQGGAVPDVEGRVTFSGVGFSYDERRILDGFTLDIKKGGTVALVGESGSGKSTAARLLAGLLLPGEGRVLVDGVDLGEIDLNHYYESIAYLPQESPVFDGTLRENLIFDGEAGEDVLLEAIRLAGLSELYGKLEKGLDTPVGERGVRLSGGERQRLALARLWFSNARIVILDEATSAMDNLTEEMVMNNVMRLLNGKTLIVVAHRLNFIKSFDEIVVLQGGRIAERGSFEDLMEKRGPFYELYNRTPV